MTEKRTPTLSVRGAAEALDVHYMTAYRYVRTGVLPAEMVGGRWRIRQDDLELSGNPAGPGGRSGSIEHRRERLVSRLVAGDEQGVWSLVEGALVGGLDPSEVHLDLLAPALATIGDRWEAGTLSVGEEHKAAAVCHRLVGRLGPRFVRRGRRRGVVILAGAPGDSHALPTALAADVVRASGYAVVDMGAAVPPEDLAAEARSIDRLVAVGITVTTGGHEGSIAESVAATRRAVPGRPVFVGGSAVDERLAARVGADGHGSHAGHLVELLGALAPVA